MTDKTPLYLVDKFVELLDKHVDSPKVFKEMTALSVIAFALGRFFSIHGSKIHRPNTWFTISSIPGAMRRSSLVGYFCERPLFLCLVKYYMWSEKLDYNSACAKFRLSVLEGGTPQGYMDKISTAIEQGIDNFIILDQEFGITLRKICKTNNPSQDMDRLLSKMYYGESYTEDLSKREGKPSRHMPIGLYFTMLSSMQEPSQYIGTKISRQGLLRRILIAYLKTGDLKIKDFKDPVDGTDSYDQYSDIQEFVDNKLLPLMEKYHKSLEDYRDTEDKDLDEREFQPKEYLEIILSTAVKKSIGKIAYDCHLALIGDESDYHIYQQNKWENLVKIASLYAIADGRILPPQIPGHKPELYVEDIHYQRAVELIEMISKHTEEMIEEVDVREEKATINKSISRLEKLVKKAGPEGILRNDLLGGFGGDSNKFNLHIRTLIERGVVISEKTNIGKPGVTGTRYVHSVYRKENNSRRQSQ